MNEEFPTQDEGLEEKGWGKKRSKKLLKELKERFPDCEVTLSEDGTEINIVTPTEEKS